MHVTVDNYHAVFVNERYVDVSRAVQAMVNDRMIEVGLDPDPIEERITTGGGGKPDVWVTVRDDHEAFLDRRSIQRADFVRRTLDDLMVESGANVEQWEQSYDG